MIVFVNPRATRAKNRRFPLSVMAIGAALPADVSWEIVEHVERQRGSADPVRVVAFTVMPGPQLVSAVPLARALRASCPDVEIVWGGNFASLYPAPVLAAPYVDWVVRGQGEQTFVELLSAAGNAAIQHPDSAFDKRSGLFNHGNMHQDEASLRRRGIKTMLECPDETKIVVVETFLWIFQTIVE